ncbi:MAG: hypothetical protein II411_00395 [Lachnospiraceae bacterium]|nr:hypothetical protein [Lachnospiraceae bacterium]
MTKNGYPGEVVDEPCVFARYKYSVDCDTIIDEKTAVLNGAGYSEGITKWYNLK